MWIKKVLFLGFAFSALQMGMAPLRALALEDGCTLMPAEIPAAGNRVLTKARALGKPFPNHVNTRTMFEGHFRKSTEPPPEKRGQLIGTIEGFFRPLEDMSYSYFAIPFLEFQLFRKHNLVYVCAHSDPDPERTHLTLYILGGFGLDPWKWDQSLEDYFRADGVEFATVPVQFMGLRNKVPLFPLLEKIPLIGQIIQIPDTILDKLNTALGEALTTPAGAHIQRMVITAHSIELDSSFDPQHPEKAEHFFRFDFPTDDKSPEIPSSPEPSDD